MIPQLAGMTRQASARLRFYLTSRRSRILLSAGMPRSGSTWLYNAVRLLLRQQIGNELSCGWIDDLPKLPRKRVLLLKLHDFDPFLARHADLILYSYRDLRDALASTKRKFNIEPTLQMAAKFIDHDKKWRRRADYTVRYEMMMDDPKKVLARLAAMLDAMDVDISRLLGQLEKLEFDHADSQAGYDVENLLHASHITDGRHGSWNGWLDPEFVRKVEEEYHEWLVQNGYSLGAR